jgi:hypothetical protein
VASYLEPLPAGAALLGWAALAAIVAYALLARRDA